MDKGEKPLQLVDEKEEWLDVTIDGEVDNAIIYMLFDLIMQLDMMIILWMPLLVMVMVLLKTIWWSQENWTLGEKKRN